MSVGTLIFWDEDSGYLCISVQEEQKVGSTGGFLIPCHPDPGQPLLRVCLQVNWRDRKHFGLHYWERVKKKNKKHTGFMSVMALYVCCFPSGLLVTNPTTNAEDVGLIPGLGRSPREGNGNPLLYSSLETPWTEEAGGLQSMGWQRVRHCWAPERAGMHTPFFQTGEFLLWDCF